jgi:hypothetical protein
LVFCRWARERLDIWKALKRPPWWQRTEVAFSMPYMLFQPPVENAALQIDVSLQGHHSTPGDEWGPGPTFQALPRNPVFHRSSSRPDRVMEKRGPRTANSKSDGPSKRRRCITTACQPCRMRKTKVGDEPMTCRGVCDCANASNSATEHCRHALLVDLTSPNATMISTQMLGGKFALSNSMATT